MRHLPTAAALLALLVPAAARAQSPAAALGTPHAAPAVPTGYGSEPAPPQARGEGHALDVPAPPRPHVFTLVGGLAETPPADSPTRDGARGPSFGASFGHAFAGYGIGVAAGALTGGAIAGAACNDGGWCVLAALFGGGAGAILAAPFGAGLATWGFGELSGGTGNAFASIGGAYLGSVAGAGLTAALAQLEPTFGTSLGVAAAVVLTNLGAAIGYQVTSHGPREAPADRADRADRADHADRAVLVPTVAPSADGRGVTLGAAGLF
jgi:hypothetical protein